jgi:hypothetical protein
MRVLTTGLFQQKIAGIIQEFAFSNSLKMESAVKKNNAFLAKLYFEFNPRLF